MPTILCFGDSNTWGCKPIETLGVFERFDSDERWTGVLRDELGDGYTIIEEGQNGRNTVFDDPIEGAFKNGKRYLTACLETHMPLDLVIILLGTNDLKSRFSLAPFDIASGAAALLDLVTNPPRKRVGDMPRTLLICPPPLGRLEMLSDMFLQADEKSRQLAPHFRKLAELKGSHFLDAGEVMRTSDIDGVHWEASEHAKFGREIANQVRRIL